MSLATALKGAVAADEHGMPDGARFESTWDSFRVGAVCAVGEARQQDPIVKARPTGGGRGAAGVRGGDGYASFVDQHKVG